METKIIYLVVTTLLILMYIGYTILNKPKTHLESFMRKGMTMFIAILYVITWVIWLILFKLGL